VYISVQNLHQNNRKVDYKVKTAIHLFLTAWVEILKDGSIHDQLKPSSCVLTHGTA
jgi:hypothetical protein